jgi:hypothetical protein
MATFSLADAERNEVRWQQWYQASAARRQRLHAKGHHGTGYVQLAGVKPSYFRPRVSDDNAYAESSFRTAKYRPQFPTKGFADAEPPFPKLAVNAFTFHHGRCNGCRCPKMESRKGDINQLARGNCQLHHRQS